MMWQIMLLGGVLSCSTFLPWLLRFYSIAILSPLDVTTACLLQSLVRPIKRMSIEFLRKVLIDRDERLIFLIYCWIMCCLTSKWWINWLLRRCMKRYQWLPVCCLWEFFFLQLVVVFLRYRILRSPILSFPILVIFIVHNTRNREFVFYCMYQSILQFHFPSNLQ